jgi:hypothetical protein
MRTVFIILSLLCGANTRAAPATYPSWDAQHFTETASRTYSVDSRAPSIRVSFITDNAARSSSEAFFEQVARETFLFLASRTTIRKGPNRVCNQYNIVVYDMSSSNINSRRLLYWYPWQNNSQRLYGAYDSNHTASRGTAVIIIQSDLSLTTRKRIAAHEMTHYWHDMCVNAPFNQSEQFAQGAERLY